MELKLFDSNGKQEGTIEVSEAVFNAPVKPWTVGEVVRMQQNNERLGLAHTKTRGEVSFTRRKAWRQKGTGRARSGSSRNPNWVGGGTTFGPRKHEFTYKVPRKMYRAALRSILSEKAQSEKVFVMSQLSFEQAKTKKAVEILGNLGLSEKGCVKVRSLLVLPESNDQGQKDSYFMVSKSFSNLHGAHVVKVNGMHALDLLRYEQVVLHKEALQQIEGRLS